MQISEYYDSMTPDEWKPILGPDLNYHFGFYRRGMSFEDGLSFATRRLRPFFSSGRRVLDLGCGWGGPARDLAKDSYDVLCITNSRVQYRYCQSLHLPTELMDIEREDIRCVGCFDTALMIESLDHVFEKEKLLYELSCITNRLIFITNCTSLNIDGPRVAFGGTMCMTSIATLLRMLEKTGWRVHVSADIRKYSMPTFIHWKARIEAAYPTGMKPALRLLHSLCEKALEDTCSFEKQTPLLMVCAEVIR
jgi:cyclopropane fatty-acyl-phospholipid synthase-like methyltransferase